MKSFKDTKSRDWDVSLNVHTVKLIRDKLKLNILDLDDGKTIDKLSGDPILLVDVLYLCCSEQADKLKVSDEDFGRAMAGDAIDHATTALLEELTDFFRDSRRRNLLRQILEKSREVESAMLERATAEVAKLDVTALLAKKSSDPATSSPGSSE